MSNLLIISGHGQYASGIQSSLELLAGSNELVKCIDFTVDDNEITLKQKMTEALELKPVDGVLFVCDIVGGTPFKCAVELAILNDNFEVVAGCNLGAILEMSLQLDFTSINEIASTIVACSRESTMRFEKDKILKSINIAEDSMGI